MPLAVPTGSLGREWTSTVAPASLERTGKPAIESDRVPPMGSRTTLAWGHGAAVRGHGPLNDDTNSPAF